MFCNCNTRQAQQPTLKHPTFTHSFKVCASRYETMSLLTSILDLTCTSHLCIWLAFQLHGLTATFRFKLSNIVNAFIHQLQNQITDINFTFGRFTGFLPDLPGVLCGVLPTINSRNGKMQAVCYDLFFVENVPLRVYE